MARNIRVFVISAKSLIVPLAGLAVCLAAFITAAILSGSGAGRAGGDYVILAANDLGMHCYQKDFSGFLILPPGNTLKLQVFRRGGDEAELVNSGIEVFYKIIDNTTSFDKTNFWDYAAQYGYNVPPDVGITGNGLQGKFKLSADGKYFYADGIPVTPYNDGSMALNPYQLARVEVRDSAAGTLLASTDDLVVPVSDEMMCSVCHGSKDTDLDILQAHDELSGTTLTAELAAGKRYKCSDCHADVILGQKGKPGLPPLSQAMHGFHADKMALSSITPQCYSCHPGPVTQCNRGRMHIAGITCDNKNCHGSMENVALSQQNGRQAWLQGPNCGSCHGPAYAVNPGELYRNSYLMNGPDEEMNNRILCESCHNSTHAEWVSSQPIDNRLPASLLGYASYIDQCRVCHSGSGKIHKEPG